MSAATVDVAARTAELFTALGNTKQTVADRLLEAGHFGEAGSAVGCPVARYLTAALPLDFIYVDDSDAIYVGTTWVDVPEAVAEFIVAFDRGAYPDLIAADGGATRG